MPGWKEYAILFTALVGSPGTNKSHPLSFAVQPLIDFDTEQAAIFSEAMKRYEAAMELPPKDRAHAACMNFVNALEKLPETIRQHRERAEKKRVDVPTLEAIVSRTWGKENELKALKSQLAALDCKITAALAAKNEEQDGEENKQQPDTQRVEVRDNQSQATGPKETMVAEPVHIYTSRRAFSGLR